MPKYKNEAGQPREKCMVTAYALVKNYGAEQNDVARVMKCSQGTISNWVKEVGFRREIADLSSRLYSASDYINELASELKLVEFNPEYHHEDDSSDES